MAPIVHGLEDQYQDRMKFTYLDIDDPANLDAKRTLGFRVQPEFYLLDPEGKVVKKWIGPVKEEAFITEFEKALDS